MKTIIQSKCMTCGIIYDTKDGKGQSGISHGYCKDCVKIELEKAKALSIQQNELEQVMV